jgi:hypothetical protein
MAASANSLMEVDRGSAPANSPEETGLPTRWTCPRVRTRQMAASANSLTEVDRGSEPANSPEETGLPTRWTCSRVRTHQSPVRWSGADGGWSR